MAKKELVPGKQEKAQERLKNFRIELVEYRQRFDLCKKNREDSVRLFWWIAAAFKSLSGILPSHCQCSLGCSKRPKTALSSSVVARIIRQRPKTPSRNPTSLKTQPLFPLNLSPYPLAPLHKTIPEKHTPCVSKPSCLQQMRHWMNISNEGERFWAI